jgi:hypothetical protein
MIMLKLGAMAAQGRSRWFDDVRVASAFPEDSWYSGKSRGAADIAALRSSE